MPLVYSFFHDDVRESPRSEEENRKIGLVSIDTQRGVIWANPNSRERVLQKFGSPLIVPPPPPLKGPPPPPPLKGPPPPPPLNRMLGPPPPPPLNNKLGPPPPPQLNKVLAPPPVLVGMSKAPPKPLEPRKEDNKSSAVPKEQMNAFVEGLVDSEELGFPVYSVCDNNSFHTSGYLWGYYAALMVKKLRLDPGPIAVVNFDSHQDAGSADSPIVASDRWGAMLVKAISGLGYPACYLSAFNKVNGGDPGQTFAHLLAHPALPPKETRKAELNPPKSIIPQRLDEHYEEKMEVIRTEFRSFWAAMNEHFGEPIKYVFFTIDRDVLNDSYTQWGNGKIRSTRQLIELMKAVLGPLNLLRGSSKPQAKLIGFDVTGLPESRDWQAYEPSGPHAEPKVVWAKLAEELYEVLDFVHTRLLDARKTIYVSHVFFFSGSISYASIGGKEPMDWNCWHYVSHLARYLRRLVAAKNVFYQKGWNYVLCQQATKCIYDAAWKRFTLYKPKDTPQPCKLEDIEQLEEKMKAQFEEGRPLGGFSCTAGVTNRQAAARFSVERVSFDDMVKMINMFAPPE